MSMSDNTKKTRHILHGKNCFFQRKQNIHVPGGRGEVGHQQLGFGGI